MAQGADAFSLFRRPPRLGGVLAVSLAFLSTGCQGLSHSIAQWRAAYDTSGVAKGLSEDEKRQSNTMMSRWLFPSKNAGKIDDASKSGASPLVLGSDGWKPMSTPKANPEADAEIKSAHDLYMQDKFADAERQFAKIAKNRKGSPWGEKAQFFLAETQLQQKKYVSAHDSYERLFADYPGTQRLEKLVNREYEIAQIWLAQCDPATKSDKLFPWYAHLDGREPMLDTAGSALKALEHVRTHDPTGPLADDSLMQIAHYHMRNQDYESASIYYDQLIQDHPKSPLAREAHLAAIDARMKGYLGPEYDASGLDRSRELVKQTLSKYPEQLTSTNELYHTLDLINDAQAQKDFETGSYYKRVGEVSGAEYYFGKIPQRWPDSPWAKKAKVELASLAKLPRKKTLPSKIMTQPGANDPYYSSGPGMGGMGGGMGGMGGMGMGGAPGGMM